jgi:hypothetical protein
MQQTPNLPNGKNLTMWLLGFLVPPVIGVAVAWVTHTSGTVQTHGEHIAVMQVQMSDTRDELRRINGKLDRLLDHNH